MPAQTLPIALHAMLAAALVWAIVGDVKRREIPNWLVAGIASAAPMYWWASGMAPWPDMAIRVGVALMVFILFAGVFFIGAMGGGDVKLIGALALWFPFHELAWLLIAMSLAGCALTLGYWAWHRLSKALGKLEVPYGVAIAVGAFWVLGERYLNHFA